MLDFQIRSDNIRIGFSVKDRRERYVCFLLYHNVYYIIKVSAVAEYKKEKQKYK